MTSAGGVRSSGTRQINSIQLLRGVLALSVVAYHTHIILAIPRYGGHEVFGDIVSQGWIRINLFFTLSGFILTHAHLKDMGKAQGIGSYLWKRAWRLYPIYWVCITLYLIASAAGIGSQDFSWSIQNIASSYLLFRLGEHLSLPLQVVWTLFYEVNFYVMFVFFIINARLGIIAFALWLAAIMYSSFILGNVELGPLHMWNIHFFFGMVSYFIYDKIVKYAPRVIKAGPIIAALGAVLIVYVLHIIPSGGINVQQSHPLSLLMLGGPCALLLLGIILSELWLKWPTPRFFLFLGKASYAIFLVHSPVISVIAMLAQAFIPGVAPPALLFIFAAIMSTIAGIMVHLIIEKPLIRLFSKRPASTSAPIDGSKARL